MTATGRDGGAAPAAARGPGLRTTLATRAVMAASAVAVRLPEPLLAAAAEAAGELWYRLAPGRARLLRANLARVCADLAATGRGPARARRAATEPAELERLVRAAFRHLARYWVDVARAPGIDPAAVLARIDVGTPEVVAAGLVPGRPIVLVGLHFGALEPPIVFLRSRTGHQVAAPMEAVADPALQRWIEAARVRAGARPLPIRDARRGLLAALRAGESVGLVADRDLTGGGIPVPLFGRPAPVPAGPALLALEAGVPLYVGWGRRTGGRIRVGMREVPPPPEGERRARLEAFTASIAAAMEDVVAEAPEQWFAAFHPLWPDLADAAA